MSEISTITLPDGSSYAFKDAAVPEWAKTPTKPGYEIQEIDNISYGTELPSTGVEGQIFLLIE